MFANIQNAQKWDLFHAVSSATIPSFAMYLVSDVMLIFVQQERSRNSSSDGSIRAIHAPPANT
jgi:hypothetical protein